MASLPKQIFHSHPRGFSTTKCFISFRQRLEMSQGIGLFVSLNDYSGHQNIPLRETHVIPTKIDWRQKIIMVFLAAQCSSSKKSRLNHSTVSTREIYAFPTTLSILRKYAQKALCTKTPLSRGVTGKTFTDTEKKNEKKNKTNK